MHLIRAVNIFLLTVVLWTRPKPQKPSENFRIDVCLQFYADKLYYQTHKYTQQNIFEFQDLIKYDCTLDRARRWLITMTARVNETEKFFELCKNPNLKQIME